MTDDEQGILLAQDKALEILAESRSKADQIIGDAQAEAIELMLDQQARSMSLLEDQREEVAKRGLAETDNTALLAQYRRAAELLAVAEMGTATRGCARLTRMRRSTS